METPQRLPRRNLDAVITYLETGLTLEVWERNGKRVFRKGDVTRDMRPNGSVRTKHLSRSLNGYVWLTRDGIRQLAEQARERWPQREEMLRRQAETRAAFFER